MSFSWRVRARATMWYVWDLGLYIAGTEAIVQRSCSKAAMECEDGWLDVPDVLAFYDYVGHNPAKGGLFRVGAMNTVFLPHWARDVH